MVNEIKDLEIYNTEMAKSMYDKAFFVDHIDFDVLVDFGCANGTLLTYYSKLNSNKIYIGYDNNPQELELVDPKFKTFSDWNLLEKYLETLPGKKLLVFNSVLHEVFGYQTDESIWEKTKTFDVVVVRDMLVDPFLKWEKINKKNRTKLFVKKQKLLDFEKIWGSVTNVYNLVHFVLKYRYDVNWKREVEENYLSIDKNQVFRKLFDNGFRKIVYHKEFVLPFIKKRAAEDLGIDLKTNTHIKLIVEK